MSQVFGRRRQWYHLRVRVEPEQGLALSRLAGGRRQSLSQLMRSVIGRELDDAETALGSAPDESAVREMAILIVVELVLKLQEASIPGGPTLSRRLLEHAARTAVSRIELVEARLRQERRR